MTTSALESLYGAIYAALTSDLQLSPILADRVFDIRAPGKPTFPYITLGDASELAFDTFGGDGSDAPRTIHLWTHDGTTQQLLVLWGHVQRLLSGALPMSARVLVWSDVSLVSIMEDPDDAEHLTMHGVVRFRALTEVP